MTRYETLLKNAFDPEAFRREGHLVIDMLADFLAASNPEARPRVLAYEDPESMARSWEGRFGAGPTTDFSDLLPEILARSIDLFHPRFVGHQCTTSLPLAALGGLAGEFLNNGSAIYEMGQVNVAMEATRFMPLLGPLPQGTPRIAVVLPCSIAGLANARVAVRAAVVNVQTAEKLPLMLIPTTQSAREGTVVQTFEIPTAELAPGKVRLLLLRRGHGDQGPGPYDRRADRKIR